MTTGMLFTFAFCPLPFAFCLSFLFPRTKRPASPNPTALLPAGVLPNCPAT
jgi:hypothetical protein